MPAVDGGEVLVKVRYCGVCGSDLHLFQNIDHVKPGDTLGHEISGVVTKTGRGVTHVREGDRVTALCSGGYSEYVKATSDRVIPLAPGVTFQQAALSEPFAVGLRSVRDSPLRPGDRAAVIGAGPIGLFTMMAARLAGALEVYAVEISPARLKTAQRIGAAAVFNPKTQNVVQEMTKVAPEGVDVVYDCAGGRGTLDLAVQLLKKGGGVMIVGLSGLADEFTTRFVFGKHATIKAVPGALEVWPLSVQLIGQGRVDPSAIVSDIVPLEDLPRFMNVLQDPSSHVQVLIDPWGSRF